VIDDDTGDEPAILKLVRPTPGEPPIRRSPNADMYSKGCEHKLFYVDPEKRTVECRICGVPVDPFDAVLVWMERDYNLDYRVQHLKELQERFDRREQRRREYQDKRKAKAAP